MINARSTERESARAPILPHLCTPPRPRLQTKTKEIPPRGWITHPSLSLDPEGIDWIMRHSVTSLREMVLVIGFCVTFWIPERINLGIYNYWRQWNGWVGETVNRKPCTFTWQYSNEDFLRPFWEHIKICNSGKQCSMWKEPWLLSPAGPLACNLRQNIMHLTSWSGSNEIMWVKALCKL